MDGRRLTGRCSRFKIAAGKAFRPICPPGILAQELHLVADGAGGRHQIEEMARKAVRHECPRLEDDVAARVMTRFWRSEGIRADWATWRELMAADLPKGWENPKVKFLRQVADQHVDIRQDIVDDLLCGATGAAETHVNVFGFIAADHPQQWLAGRVQRLPSPGAGGVEKLAVGAVAKAAGQLASGRFPARSRTAPSTPGCSSPRAPSSTPWPATCDSC
jgi:hypothetical protein